MEFRHYAKVVIEESYGFAVMMKVERLTHSWPRSLRVLPFLLLLQLLGEVLDDTLETLVAPRDEHNVVCFDGSTASMGSKGFQIHCNVCCVVPCQ